MARGESCEPASCTTSSSTEKAKPVKATAAPAKAASSWVAVEEVKSNASRLGVASSNSISATDSSHPATPQASGTSHRLALAHWRSRNHVTASDRTGAPGRHGPVSS